MNEFGIAKMIERIISVCILVLVTDSAGATEFEVHVFEDIAYKSGPELSDYEKQRCALDLHVPKGKTAFPTLVWFHGGGIRNGDKANDVTLGVAHTLAKQGVAVAAVNYRLSPEVQFPAYIEDCAASVKWIRDRIARHGGDSKRVFIGGHSAGGYLTMILIDPRYFDETGLNYTDIAGLIPVSGQMVTHSTVRAERKMSENRVIVDQAAPLFHVRESLPRTLLIAADDDLPMRLEENVLMEAALRARKNEVSLFVAEDRDHGTIVRRIPNADDPVAEAIINFIIE